MKTENKKRIELEIPDGLSSYEEAAEIGKRLMQKSLSGSGYDRNNKQIGERTKIKHLETIIVIKRKGGKYIETLKCSVCGCDYQSDLAKKIFVNYGGVTKQRTYCSDNCDQSVIDVCGTGRAAFKKKDLKFNYFF